ncbi:UDP-N-acetylglucosamine 2-epimerase (non-hydrolyzing) [Halobacteriovorax sp. ZH4_bin.1]|uniref:non-hydrolyzing UDP-N-acetylglucosamine 2-epimerase n=1 Tax=unclassified Halobacteriovorax TaxID=2639665 RepID=UPI00371D7447
MPLKVMTIVGTRPEIIKLSRVIPLIDKFFDHILVHTGQNYDYELNEVFFNDLEIRQPDHFLNAAKGSAIESIAEIIKASGEVLEKEKPDALLLYGDTNSCLSVLAAKKLKIPIFHMEAGNRCFDQRVPEEINRKIVDHLSDINFVHSEHSRRYLIDEGLRPEQIIKSGSPMTEVLNKFLPSINESKILANLKLSKKDYFLVSVHREENLDNPENFKDLLDSLNTVATSFNKRIIVSTHPRTRKKLESLNDTSFNPLIEFMKPVGYFDYNNLQINSLCTISDSGTITEESSLLKFPAITIRQAHERPEGMDAGILIMSGLKPDDVINSINIAIEQSREFKNSDIEDYSNQNISYQVVKVIQSYTGYINRTTWKKTL